MIPAAMRRILSLQPDIWYSCWEEVRAEVMQNMKNTHEVQKYTHALKRFSVDQAFAIPKLSKL